MSMSGRDIHEGKTYFDPFSHTKKVTRIIKKGTGFRVQWEGGSKKGECKLSCFASWADREMSGIENCEVL